MDVRLLGPLEVRLGDGPVDLGPRKQRAVLAMLALEAGRTVSVDRLAEGLWGEEPPASAGKMIQLYVSHLRRALDGHAGIVTRGRGYELQAPEEAVDAVRFERLLDESRAREALGLWHGDPLADVADEPFAAAEIRRLDALRLRAAESAIDADLAVGRHAEVIGELDALVAANPLREHLHAQRMLALYRSGRQSEALAAYRDARAVLVEEVGVEPGAELHELHERILAHDPALDLPEPAAAEPADVPRPPNRRLLVGAAVLLLAGITAFGIIRVLQPEGLPGIDENYVGRIDPESLRITQQIPVGGGPSAATDGGGSIWIANAADGTVSRIDRKRDEAVRITVGGAPAAVAYGGGSLWVADSDSRDVVQVDPGANKVVQRIPVGNVPRALAATGGAVWVASGVDGRIRRIDRGRPTRPIAVGANPSAIAAGAGRLWVASEEAGTVTSVDPRSGSVASPIRVGNGPSALAVGEGAVWVVNRHDGTLSRLDPDTNNVTWTDSVGSDPTAVAVGEGSVWVAGGDDGTVVQIDPDGPTVVATRPTGSRPAAIAVAGGSVWTAADAPQSAHRGGTLRALVQHAPGSLVPMDWLHPAAFTTWASSQFGSLAYDGLVAYRRVEGAAGATLVGALATDVPPPSPDRKTYVFTLRPGLRFSDGRLVGPEDVRASMERFLQATRGRPSEQQFPPFYAGIVGARKCMAGSAPCELARGIETDAEARTVAIHLTRPDADFLHKLAILFAFVVPADSVRRAGTGPPPPGTGPYRITAWDSVRGGTFVRNRHYRSTPARPGGDGFADRIDVRLYDEPAIEPQIAAVQRGDADIVALAHTFGSSVSSDRLRALLARSPGRVHSAPAATSDWMFFNVRRRPFDDPRVREAINFAIDRARVVELTGGPEVGQLTCQFVPALYPGYEPYCPYTAKPGPGRVWSAPDMERARRLVAASGRAGERVVVHMPDYKAQLARYYAALLEDLGFRTTLRIQGWNEYDIYEDDTRATTGLVQWGADYMAASNYFEPHWACNAGAENIYRLCDRGLDRQIARAVAAPQTDTAVWAELDRRVVDLAPAVPLTTRRSAVLVSERVGNVRTHQQLFTLIDQMWVR